MMDHKKSEIHYETGWRTVKISVTDYNSLKRQISKDNMLSIIADIIDV